MQEITSQLSKSFENLLPPSQSVGTVEVEQVNPAVTSSYASFSAIKSPISSPQESTASVLIVTASYDHTIRFWEVLEGTCLATLQHNESVRQTTIKSSL